MAEPESIIIEHYKAVREEEMERLRHRDKYLILYITGVGLLLGVYISDTKWWGLLEIIPLFTLLISFLYAHTDVTLGSLSKWLRYQYTAMINKYKEINKLQLMLDHWDGSSAQKEYVSDLEFGLRYIVVGAMLGAISVTSIILSFTLLKTNYFAYYEWILGIQIVLTILAIFAPIWAWRKRVEQLKEN